MAVGVRARSGVDAPADGSRGSHYDELRTRPIRIGVQLPEVERPVPLARVRRHGARRPRTSASTRSGSATTCSTATRSAARADRGRPGRRWPASRRRRAGSSSGRSSPATSFHNPAMLAKKAATVDEISGGRLILGLGAGWNETEYRAFGFPFDHRVSPLRGGVHDHPDAAARRPRSTSRALLPGARLRAAAARAAAGRAAAADRLERRADAVASRCPHVQRGTPGTAASATGSRTRPRCWPRSIARRSPPAATRPTSRRRWRSTWTCRADRRPGR